MSKKHYACNIYCYRIGKFICCRYCTGFFVASEDWRDCDEAACFKDPTTCNHGIPFDEKDCDFGEEDVTLDHGDTILYCSYNYSPGITWNGKH